MKTRTLPKPVVVDGIELKHALFVSDEERAMFLAFTGLSNANGLHALEFTGSVAEVVGRACRELCDKGGKGYRPHEDINYKDD